MRQFVQPKSMEEAYACVSERNGTVLGGMMWLRLQKKKNCPLAVDLSNLSLETVSETENGLQLGAYVTLRTLETDARLSAYSHGAFAACTKSIIGVQFRNLATVGGSIAGCFGFSDIACVGASLGMEAHYYHHGAIPVDTLLEPGNAVKKDILTAVLLPPEAPLACAYEAFRNTAADFPVLNVCVTVRQAEIACAVGARPGKAKVLRLPGDFPLHDENARSEFAIQAADSLTFDTNSRASASYRKALCKVLIRRAMEQVSRQISGGK